MQPMLRAFARVLVVAVTVTGGLLAAGTLGVATACAHVRVTADGAEPGAYATLTFSVPNESETGALTTRLDVALPNVAAASAETVPGWTARLDRDVAAGTVRSVQWTANPPTGIPADQFGLFRLSVKLPDARSVSLPATQSYSDGTVVEWNQPTPPGGSEPERPAPELDLEAAVTPRAGRQLPAAAADDTARWLAGAALVVAALGLVTAATRGRRT